MEPILKRLGEHPSPQQLLDLKVCDPAMGSGAFLVEVCRHLGDELVHAWHFHKQLPKIPPDEDEILHARRLIAQAPLIGSFAGILAGRRYDWRKAVDPDDSGGPSYDTMMTLS